MIEQLQCGTVFTVRSSKVLYGAMRCGEYVSSTMRHGKGAIRCGKLERHDAIRRAQYM